MVGMVPKRATDEGESEMEEELHCDRCIIRPDTLVTCFSKLYRLVFVLDLSPSLIVAVNFVFFFSSSTILILISCLFLRMCESVRCSTRRSSIVFRAASKESLSQ